MRVEYHGLVFLAFLRLMKCHPVKLNIALRNEMAPYPIYGASKFRFVPVEPPD